jgi:hypothetical protein
VGLHRPRVGGEEEPFVDVCGSKFYPFREGFPPSFFCLCRFEPFFLHPTGISWVPGR